jgi:hypothetical protein
MGLSRGLDPGEIFLRFIAVAASRPAKSATNVSVGRTGDGEEPFRFIRASWGTMGGGMLGAFVGDKCIVSPLRLAVVLLSRRVAKDSGIESGGTLCPLVGGLEVSMASTLGDDSRRGVFSLVPCWG